MCPQVHVCRGECVLMTFELSQRRLNYEYEMHIQRLLFGGTPMVSLEIQ